MANKQLLKIQVEKLGFCTKHLVFHYINEHLVKIIDQENGGQVNIDFAEFKHHAIVHLDDGWRDYLLCKMHKLLCSEEEVEVVEEKCGKRKHKRHSSGSRSGSCHRRSYSRSGSHSGSHGSHHSHRSHSSSHRHCPTTPAP